MIPAAAASPLLALACPLVCAPLLYLLRNRPNGREACTIVAAVAQFALVLCLAPPVLRSGAIDCHILAIAPGLTIAMRVDAFGLLFAITSSFLWILVSLYSIGYMRTLNEHAQTRYYAMFALAIFSAVCIAFSANLSTFYIFYETLKPSRVLYSQTASFCTQVAMIIRSIKDVVNAIVLRKYPK